MPKATITYNSQTISDVDETAPVSVSYNGTTIATVAAGDSKTLNCNGKVMASNVVIGSKTLQCAGKTMASNVLIVVESSGFNPVFANNSWADIIAACQVNTVPASWAVGDIKNLQIGSSTYRIRIIGKGHDIYSDTLTPAPLTLQMVDCFATKYAMNSSRTNVGGWEQCSFRATANSTILGLFPTEIKNAIRNVNKTTTIGNKSSTTSTTSDKLFLLSELEVFGVTKHGGTGEGTQYAFFANGGDKRYSPSTGVGASWGLRSPRLSNTTAFCAIDISASAYYTNGNSTIYQPLAFCF